MASTKILQLTEELANVKQYSANINAARNSLSLTETSLNGVTDLIHRIQELAISAGNTATLSKMSMPPSPVKWIRACRS